MAQNKKQSKNNQIPARSLKYSGYINTRRRK
jgi:hypothetical protein